jgi:transposase
MQIIGVDVSKLTLNFHCFGQKSSPDAIGNNASGFKTLHKWIRTKVSPNKEDVLIVMEYTGIYTYAFERFLSEKGWKYVKRPALDIKLSAGMKRGKTDVMDARMISRYGWQKQAELKPMTPPSDTQVKCSS